MDKDIPIYFVAEPERRAMLVRVAIGAAAGLLWYLNDKYIINNVLSHVNHKVIVEYHPHMLEN